MNASTKTMLMQWYPFLSLTVLPFIICSFADSLLYAVILMAVYVLLWLIINKLPVDCSQELCIGQMRQTMTRLSFWKLRVHYQCDFCGFVIETDIFVPDITVEVSG